MSVTTPNNNPRDVRTETDAEFEKSLAAAKPTELDPAVLYSLVLPAGADARLVDLEKHLPWPRRKSGTFRPMTLASFIEYARNHRSSEHTTVWIDPTSFKVLAILNDHAGSDSGAGWGDHRAELQLAVTPEWKHWLGLDGKLVTQQVFAEHIEDGINEIHKPTGADMLEIAQTFQGKTKVEWRSATRLQNGEVQLAYLEEIDATAGRAGDMEIPQQIELSISPFLGEEPRLLRARLRTRLTEGHLTIGYKLDHPERVLDEVMEHIAGTLTADHSFSHVYLGTPRA